MLQFQHLIVNVNFLGTVETDGLHRLLSNVQKLVAFYSVGHKTSCEFTCYALGRSGELLL